MAVSKGSTGTTPAKVNNKPNNGATTIVSEVQVFDGRLEADEVSKNPGVKV